MDDFLIFLVIFLLSFFLSQEHLKDSFKHIATRQGNKAVAVLNSGRDTQELLRRGVGRMSYRECQLHLASAVNDPVQCPSWHMYPFPHSLALEQSHSNDAQFDGR
jgi:hypothetical protein